MKVDKYCQKYLLDRGLHTITSSAVLLRHTHLYLTTHLQLKGEIQTLQKRLEASATPSLEEDMDGTCWG